MTGFHLAGTVKTWTVGWTSGLHNGMEFRDQKSCIHRQQSFALAGSKVISPQYWSSAVSVYKELWP